MSHFMGLVFGDGLDEQLAPFQGELEVEFNDCTEEVQKNYLEGTYKEHERSAPGVFSSRDKVIAEMPFTEKYESLIVFAKDYYGYETRLEGNEWRFGYMHNPQAKWDWWQAGGRWAGWLLHKPLDQCKRIDLIERGNPSLLMYGFEYEDRCVDQCALCDIDWEGMKKQSVDAATERYDRAVEAQKQGDPHAMMWINWGYQGEGNKPRQEYIDEHASVTPYCFVVDGKWYEQGEMGWFGVSSNEKDCSTWSKEFELMLDELPEDTLVTVVDFHI